MKLISNPQSAVRSGATRLLRAPAAALCAGWLLGCGDTASPKAVTVTTVQFASVAVPGTTAATAVQLTGHLYLPPGSPNATNAVVILPTSSGIRQYREPYYAETFANAGFAVLIVDSFGSRGIISAVEDQSLLTSYQLEADAFGALHFLLSRERIRREGIALMGASKGGTAALNSVFLIRESWRRTTARFAAHVALTPDCTVTHRSLATTGAPLLIVLAENDDYADPAPCHEYAPHIAGSTGATVAVHEVAGAAHGWERFGPPQLLATAENFSGCRGIMEDDGRISIEGGAAPLTSAEYLGWARETCVYRGAHSGGGTAELRDATTSRILAFLKEALSS